MANYRSLVPLGGATVIALIVSILTYGYLQNRVKVNDVVAGTHPVAVAMADLPWGTKLTGEMMKQVDFLKGSLPEGSFSDTTSLVGRVLIYPVKTKEPILESRLAPTNVKTSGVAAVISPQKRAVAVKIDKVIGVSGFVHPGSRVDVLITLAAGRTSHPITKTVLENLLVLAAGSETKEKKGLEERVSSADVITLEVTPEEAEKLAMAAAEGRIQLALRNFNDTENVITSGVTISSLLASYSKDGPAWGDPQKETGAKKPVPQYQLPSSVTEEKVEGKKPPVVGEVKPATVEDKNPPRVEMITPPAVEKKPSVFVVELIKGSKVSEITFKESDETR
jgi:pilus assembly protein CpaB